MQISLTKQKLFFLALITVGAFCGGVLSVGAYGISPDPAEFTSTSTSFSYFTNPGEFAVQYRKSGLGQQRIGDLLLPDLQNGSLQSQSGGEPVGTLDIVFLNSLVAHDYCVLTTYSDCINAQSSYILATKQIVYLGINATSTPSSTSTISIDYTQFFNFFVLFFSFLYFIIVVYLVKAQLLKFL